MATASPFGAPTGWTAAGMALSVGAAGGSAAAFLRRRRPTALLLAIGVLGVGIWRAAGDLQAAAGPWADVPTTPMRLIATLEGPVEHRGATASMRARVERVERPEGLVPPEGRLRVTLSALPPFEVSDRIEIVGRVDPVDVATPFGRRLLAQGVVATAAFPGITAIGRAERPAGGWVERLRATLQRTIQHMLPEPQAGLLSGLLVGSTGGMPEEFRRALAASGTTHIVVVSGYNITLVAAALQGICRDSRRLRMVVPLLGVWAFAALTGGAAPSIRAAIMASVALLATGTGRGRDALAALALASAGMLAVDPRLVSDLSFQLSVCATLGLIALQPRVAALMPGLHPLVREPIAATLAAQLATAPLLAATFHQLSLVAPLANALVAPAIPVATIGGGIGAAIAIVLPAVASGIGFVLALPTSYVVAVIEHSAAVPHATTPVGDVVPAVVALYAAALLVWAIAPTPEGRGFAAAIRTTSFARPAAAVVAFAGAGMLAWGASATADAPFTLWVLDVGEGDAILLRTPGQRTVLIDGGPDPTALLDHLGRRLGIAERNLSIAVLTAADGERLPGSVAALERYPAGLTVAPPEGSASALYERWRAATAGSTQLFGDAPTRIDVEPGLAIELLASGPLASPARPDGLPLRTLVVRIMHGEVTALVAPTLTADGARQAIADGWPLAADVLVVPRHGDGQSLSPAMLDAVDPSLAIISVGARNRAGHPAGQALSALGGIPTFRTDLHGTIELISDGRRLWVVPERPPARLLEGGSGTRATRIRTRAAHVDGM